MLFIITVQCTHTHRPHFKSSFSLSVSANVFNLLNMNTCHICLIPILVPTSNPIFLYIISRKHSLNAKIDNFIPWAKIIACKRIWLEYYMKYAFAVVYWHKNTFTRCGQSVWDDATTGYHDALPLHFISFHFVSFSLTFCPFHYGFVFCTQTSRLQTCCQLYWASTVRLFTDTHAWEKSKWN